MDAGPGKEGRPGINRKEEFDFFVSGDWEPPGKVLKQDKDKPEEISGETENSPEN